VGRSSNFRGIKVGANVKRISESVPEGSKGVSCVSFGDKSLACRENGECIVLELTWGGLAGFGSI
jgi:hypothetical protein